MATEPTEVERRNVGGQQVLLIVLGLVVLLAVLWFLFLRGGDDSETTPTALPTVVPTTAPTQAPVDEEDDDDGGPLETFEVFAAKDPFEPLIDDSAAAGGSTVGGTTVSPGTGTSTGGTPTTPGDSTAPGDADGGDSVGGHRVTLIDVFSRNGNQVAQVRVDGTVYTVEEGETFAENFQVLSISGDCATMLFGDDQFTLCVGEEILK